ncbi:ABC transporter permease [Zavarzinella formosa]|uniref:ABC transporter permease n=1 Tax=Zavarzinella formosa TaxID=360055 RepID=UPI0002DD3D7C|nr:FtsX-like permease family protein [Zavarzinella formosa]
MFPLFRALVLRYLWQRWDRGLLVALSISLGVATLVSAQMLNKCVELAAMDSTVPADVADLYITNGEIGVPWSLVEEVKKANIPGIKRAEPFIIERVMLPEINGRSGILFGTSLTDRTPSDEAAADKLKISFQLVNNPLALIGKPVALSRRLYEDRKKLGKADTDPVEVRYTNNVLKFNLIAVIDIPKDSPIAPFADSLVAMDVKQATVLLRHTDLPRAEDNDRVSRIDFFLEPGADVHRIMDTLQQIAGIRSTVRTPEENRKSTEEVIGGMKIVLNMCSLGSLIVGLFLVYNALSVTVAERRHDIGVMRSLGATRTQIASLFAIEAMTLGLIGAIPGIPLGVTLANFAIDQFGEEFASIFLNGDTARPMLDRRTAIFAIVAGMITSLLAALVPAMQAASDEPADAVRRAPSNTGGIMRWVHRLACVVLIVAGLFMVAYREHLATHQGSLFGMTFVLTGLFLAMPILVAWMARLLIPLCRVLLGVESRLAADNLLRAPGRTGVVIGALAAGVSLMFQTAGVGKSHEVPIRQWLRQVIQADAYVFWGNLASANSSMTPMDPKIADDIRKIEGVDRVVGLRFYRPEFRGTFVMVIGIDAADYRRALRLRMPEGLPKLEKFEELPTGNFVVVSENFAEKWKVKEGDTIAIPGPHGPIDFIIKGVGKDYTWSQGTIFIDRTVFSRVFEDRLVDAYHVFFKLDQDREATYERVRTYTDEHQLLVQNQASVQLYLVGVVDRLFRVAYLQQVVVGIVAALGVVTALLISVLQRRRELGLLRAVGATQLQIIKSVIAEAMLMGLLGTALGFAMGLPMEWYLLNVVLLEESGFRFDMLIPWEQALGIGAVAIVTSTLAGLIPAIHAVRLNITEAIAYE